MIKTGEISQRLYDYLSSKGKGLGIEDVRIGLAYAGVKLEGDRLGLAGVLRNELKPECTTLNGAGTLTTLSASSLLKYLVDGKNPLDKALGLATANAIINPETSEEEIDTIGLMNLGPQDNVAMVGYFGPLVGKIKETGANLSIIERDPARVEIIDDRTKDEILGKCTVAVITATSILNDTLEEILNKLGNSRHVVILGPSTPMCRDVFQGTPVTHLGGSAILDIRKIMQIISEGGGTPAMRPCLRFINVLLR
ncbi:MAG: DUF364 domain-containing protein [Syntrophobacterales bacterium]|nr:DUF364 domain-containing protein [Syntrophobacterales bacterium]